jgi:hypothetical protein
MQNIVDFFNKNKNYFIFFIFLYISIVNYAPEFIGNFLGSATQDSTYQYGIAMHTTKTGVKVFQYFNQQDYETMIQIMRIQNYLWAPVAIIFLILVLYTLMVIIRRAIKGGGAVPTEETPAVTNVS